MNARCKSVMFSFAGGHRVIFTGSKVLVFQNQKLLLARKNSWQACCAEDRESVIDRAYRPEFSQAKSLLLEAIRGDGDDGGRPAA